MSGVMAWFDGPAAQRIGWILLHSVWQGALVLGLFELARFGLRRRSAQVRYVTGCAALVLLMAAPVVTVLLQLPLNSTSAVNRAPDASLAAPDVSYGGAGVFGPGLVTPSHSLVHGTADFLGQLAPWLAAGWLAGVFFLSCRLTRSWWWVGRLRTNETEPVDSVLLEKLEELRVRLRVSRPVCLMRSALVQVPTVIGWLRPVILLPAASLTGLTPRQFEAVLAHELAHVRRFDSLVNTFQCLIETLMFYHPAVWWISRCVREERENCCDDLVVEICGDRVNYARALATLESLRADLPQLAFAASGGSLVNRVRRLVGAPADGAEVSARHFAGLALLGCGLLLVGVGIYLNVSPPLYRAEARVRLGRSPELRSDTDAQRELRAPYDPYFIQTEMELIRSRAILERVVERLGLAEEWGKQHGRGTPLETGEAVRLLQDRIFTELVRNTSLVEVGAFSRDAEEAVRLANQLAESYRDWRMEQFEARQRAGLYAVEKKLQEQNARVQQAQKKVDAWRIELAISDPDPQSTAPSPALSTETVRQVQLRLTELVTGQVQLETQLQRLRELPRSDLRSAIQTVVGSDAELGVLMAELNQAQARLVVLERDYSPEHEVMRNAQRIEADLAARIDRRVEGILIGLHTRLDSSKAAIEKLELTLVEAKERDLEAAERARPYYAAKQQLAELLQFGQILGMRIAARDADFELPAESAVQVVDRAVQPDRPISPNRPRAVAAAGLGVLLALAGVMLLRSRPLRAPATVR